MKRAGRKKRGHYHTGTHVSSKTGQECRYRSGWELLYLQHLDADPTVVTFTYEATVIPYVSNKRTGKLRKYYPDFLVDYVGGRRVLVEIKPKKRLEQARVKKKLDAAREWCGAHGVTLEVITEVELRQLGLLK